MLLSGFSGVFWMLTDCPGVFWSTKTKKQNLDGASNFDHLSFHYISYKYKPEDLIHKLLVHNEDDDV